MDALCDWDNCEKCKLLKSKKCIRIYPPNGEHVKFLNDNEIYLRNQVECLFNDDETKSCFGILVNMSFLLVCEYGENGSNPEINIYKKR